MHAGNGSCLLLFLVAPCCSQGATLLQCRWSVHPVICLWQDPPTPPPIFFIPIFFFSPPKNFFLLSLFYAFLDILCHPECSKNFHPKFFFHPKIFWVKQGVTQCYQAFLFFFFRSDENEIFPIGSKKEAFHCCVFSFFFFFFTNYLDPRKTPFRPLSAQQ